MLKYLLCNKYVLKCKSFINNYMCKQLSILIERLKSLSNMY